MRPFVFVTAPLFILYFLTSSFNFSFDAITNAIACETNEPIRWFHPNHPLMPSLGVLWFRIERFLGYDGYAIYSLARLNSLFMAMAMGLLFLILKSKIQLLKAVAVTMAVATTYSVWHYAVDGIGYGPFVFFQTLLLWLIFKLNDQSTLNAKNIVQLATVSLLYILSHGISIFHMGAVATWMWTKKWHRPAIYYMSSILTALFIIYSLIYVLVVQSEMNDFLRWSLGYAGFQGTSEAFKSEFWSFNRTDIIQQFWVGWTNTLWKPGLTQDAISSFLPHILGTLFLCIILISIFKGHHSLKPFLLVWVGSILFFLMFWSPGHTGFRLHILIPLILLIIMSFQKHRHFFLASCITGLILFSLNISGRIFDETDIKNNKGIQTLIELDKNLEPGSIFLTAQKDTIPKYGVYQPYFFPHIKGGSLDGRLFAFREKSLIPIENEYKTLLKKGVKIFVADDMLDSNIQEHIEKKRHLKPSSISKFLAQFTLTPAFELSNGTQAFLIE